MATLSNRTRPISINVSMKKRLSDKIKSLAPWWHDITIPSLNSSTFLLCGIDSRVAMSQYQLLKFPSAVYSGLGLDRISGRRILEIGPASGYYGIHLAKQGNIVTSIEMADRFIEQLVFLKSYFNLDNFTVVKNTFPSNDIDFSHQFEIVFCLGVLYHWTNFTDLIDKLDAIGAEQIYLESLVSKTGRTFQAIDGQGFAFSEVDFVENVINRFSNYTLVRRIDLNQSENHNYTAQDHYRAVFIMGKIQLQDNA